jgi:hypothetical protein
MATKHWFHSKTKAQQAAYIKAHPNSVYARKGVRGERTVTGPDAEVRRHKGKARAAGKLTALERQKAVHDPKYKEGWDTTPGLKDKGVKAWGKKKRKSDKTFKDAQTVHAEHAVTSTKKSANAVKKLRTSETKAPKGLKNKLGTHDVAQKRIAKLKKKASTKAPGTSARAATERKLATERKKLMTAQDRDPKTGMPERRR